MHTLSSREVIIIKIVHASVTGGQRKRLDPEKQVAVSLAIERQKLVLGSLCECQPWY